MRLCFIVLVAALALLAGTKRVLAAPKSDLVLTGRAFATEHNDEEKTRGLRADKTAGEEKDEERGLFDYIVDHLAAKKQYRSWYKAGLKPGAVTQMLHKREAQGREVDWVVAKGYPDYYRRRKHSFLYF